MGVNKCGCVYADSHNTSSVRRGFEMGGYLKTPCARHGGIKRGEVQLIAARRSGKSIMPMIVALQELVRLIESGIEYPDAQFKVTQKFNVDADKLQEAYDFHCRDEQ